MPLPFTLRIKSLLPQRPEEKRKGERERERERERRRERKGKEKRGENVEGEEERNKYQEGGGGEEKSPVYFLGFPKMSSKGTESTISVVVKASSLPLILVSLYSSFLTS